MLLISAIIFGDKHTRCIDIKKFVFFEYYTDSAISEMTHNCIHTLSLCNLIIKVIVFVLEVSERLTIVSIKR